MIIGIIIGTLIGIIFAAAIYQSELFKMQKDLDITKRALEVQIEKTVQMAKQKNFPAVPIDRQSSH